MRKSAKRGFAGEDLAAKYLREKGFIITERNFHSRFGEIDIIAEDEQYILFVEVKTRAGGAIVSPAEAVDLKKQQKIIMTANTYLARSHSALQPRFDVAQITVLSDGEREEYKIDYIENAFQ
ncbi:MAG: YraN family protein [Clostridia bacterium]|nr:YraN family protein [Oscillospiraceae bacterium]MBR6694664.1 YraN family protein [Clostridia bacterium]